MMEEKKASEEISSLVKDDCTVIPKTMKPLFDCCKDYSEGKLSDGDFFSTLLVKTGEFMKNVKTQPKIEE